MAKTKKPRAATTPQDEEARARRLAANLAKARKVKTERAHKRNSKLIWAVIGPRLKGSNCKCGLKKGMTLDELKALQGGCGDVYDYYHYVLKQTPPWAGMTLAEARTAGVAPTPGYVCPVLDAYRRYVERPQSLIDADREAA